MKIGPKLGAFLATAFALAGCGRVRYALEYVPPVFDAGKIDSGPMPMYDDAGRLIVVDANIPTGEVVAGTTKPVSTTGVDGTPSNGANGVGAELGISMNGAYIAYSSVASNLVTGDSNGVADVFVYDVAGNHTTRMSHTIDNAEPNAASGVIPTTEHTTGGDFFAVDDALAGPVMTADGSTVVFASKASNFVSGDTNGAYDVFAVDRGQLAGFTRVSVGNMGEESPLPSFAPSASRDGKIIVFASYSTNFVAGTQNGFENIYVRDMSGATPTTTIISRRVDGVAFDGPSSHPSISLDGRYVAFATKATNVIANVVFPNYDKVFYYDRMTMQFVLVSVDAAGNISDRSASLPRISGDGNHIAFVTSSGLIPTDANSLLDVYMISRSGFPDPVCVSVDRAGVPSTAFLNRPDLSADGRFVVFGSNSGAIVSNDLNGGGDVFVRDMTMHTTRIVSTSAAARSTNGLSLPRVISSDGTAIAFTSDADNIALMDSDGVSDVFVVENIAF